MTQVFLTGRQFSNLTKRRQFCRPTSRGGRDRCLDPRSAPAVPAPGPPHGTPPTPMWAAARCMRRCPIWTASSGPSPVAVVGASDAEGRPNTGITRQLIAWAERVGARLHPVNPGRRAVFGLPCPPSVADLPEAVDLAVLLVADPLPVIEELAEAKVKFAVAFASGFAETGEEGAAAQSRLAAAVARSGLRLLGPNTNLNAFEEFREDLDGPGHRPHHPVRPPGPPGFRPPGTRHPALPLGPHRQRGRPGDRRLHLLLRRTARGRRHRRLCGRAQGRPLLPARRRPRRPAQGARRRGQGRPHRDRRPHRRLTHRQADRRRRGGGRGDAAVRRDPRRRARRTPGHRRAVGPRPAAHRRRRRRLFDLRRHRRALRRPGDRGRAAAAHALGRQAGRTAPVDTRSTSTSPTRSTTAATRSATGAAGRSSTRSSPTPRSAC